MRSLAGRLRCPICGAPLRPASGRAECSFCGAEEEADWVCESGHYVCESCRTDPAERALPRVALARRVEGALSLASLMMRHPSVPESGPEHHLVAALSVLG
ncbi:MAG: hypothetical protein DRO06_04775, partial [Thermoproteota archaeon]